MLLLWSFLVKCPYGVNQQELNTARSLRNHADTYENRANDDGVVWMLQADVKVKGDDRQAYLKQAE